MKRRGKAAIFALPLAIGCGGWQNVDDPHAGANVDLVCEDEAAGDATGDYARGFHVVGNRIQDSAGNDVVLRGVNRSGTEYKCADDGGIFDGPSDEASIIAMKSWNINAVRVPLNESCWMALPQATKASTRYAGCNYQNAIKAYVKLLHEHGLIPILDLHWAAPAEQETVDLCPMPNADHSVEFWKSVATAFKDDEGVIFEPYNEPFPERFMETRAAWECWRDGCPMTCEGGAYQAVGMQQLVDAIRGTGASQLVLLGGLEWSNNLTSWLEYAPSDPSNNVAAAWHVYNFNWCSNEMCWNDAPARTAAEVPVVATEIGQGDCGGDFISPLMQWLDQQGLGYLAWSWNAMGECLPQTEDQAGQPWFLITDYGSGTPNSDYAQAFYDHLQGLAP